MANHEGTGSAVGARLELALRDLLRDVIRDEVRAAIREELASVLAAAPVASGGTQEYLTTDEAASMARVEPATIREWVRRGDLRRHQAGRELRVRRDELAAFLASGRRSEAEHNVESLAAKILQRGAK